VPFAHMYQVQNNEVDPSDATAWRQLGLSTSARYKVDGLTPGRFYWFRVNAAGSQGAGPVSDVARCMAA
jgi:phosphodiesterase/alkaline phosphatase D-like protein